MSRTPNDDRSDAMNPNNDAYWADQENRFGGVDDDDDWGDDGSSHRGRRQRRDPIAELRRKLELAYATPASEERDNREARVEFMRWAEEVMTVAADVATKQSFGGRLLKGDGFIELVLGTGRCVRVADVPEHALISIGKKLFGYAGRAWREAREQGSSDWREPTTYRLEMLGDAQPRGVLLGALEKGYGPTLAELRAVVEEGKHRPDLEDRVRNAREAQEKIAALKAKMPAGFANDSWEDTWTPPDEERAARG